MASQEGEGKGARRRGIARHSRARRAVVCRLLRVTPRGGPPSSPPPRAAVCAGYTGAWACRWGHAGGGAAVETPPHPRPPLVAVTWTASAQFPPPPPPTRRVVPVGVHRQGDTAGRGPPTGGHRGAVVLVAAASGRERGGGGGTVTSGQDDGRRNGGRAAVPPRTSPVCLPVRRGRAAAWPGGLGDCLAGGRGTADPGPAWSSKWPPWPPHRAGRVDRQRARGHPADTGDEAVGACTDRRAACLGRYREYVGRPAGGSASVGDGPPREPTCVPTASWPTHPHRAPSTFLIWMWCVRRRERGGRRWVGVLWMSTQTPAVLVAG